MGGIFQGFGGGSQVTESDASQPAAAGGAPDEQPAGKPAVTPAPEIVPGVPLWLHGVDGDAVGVYWLTSLDLDASHEVGQPTRHAGIDGDRQVAGIGAPVQKSGGAAYYYNVVSGRGFSVPIDPSGA